MFPDARLLELVSRFLVLEESIKFKPVQHQTECHDPIAAVRKDKGEKIVRSLGYPFLFYLYLNDTSSNVTLPLVLGFSSHRKLDVSI